MGSEKCKAAKGGVEKCRYKSKHKHSKGSVQMACLLALVGLKCFPYLRSLVQPTTATLWKPKTDR